MLEKSMEMYYFCNTFFFKDCTNCTTLDRYYSVRHPEVIHCKEIM